METLIRNLAKLTSSPQSTSKYQNQEKAVSFDPFGARDTFNTGAGTAALYRLSRLEDAGLGEISRLPFSIRVLLEAVLGNCDDF